MENAAKKVASGQVVSSGRLLSWDDFPGKVAGSYVCSQCGRVPSQQPLELAGMLSPWLSLFFCPCQPKPFLLCRLCPNTKTFSRTSTFKRHLYTIHSMTTTEESNKELLSAAQDDVDDAHSYPNNTVHSMIDSFTDNESCMNETDCLPTDDANHEDNVHQTEPLLPSTRETSQSSLFSDDQNKNKKQRTQSNDVSLSELYSISDSPKTGEFMSLFAPSFLKDHPASSKDSGKYFESIQRNNATYFEAESFHKKGAINLSTRSMFPANQSANNLHAADALFSMQCTWLVTRLKDRERNVFAMLMQYVTGGRANILGSNVGNFTTPRLPDSKKKVHQYFGDGRNSIGSLCPRPAIAVLGDGHVYVSLVDCVKDLLAHGHCVSPLQASDTSRIHAQSPRGEELIEIAIEIFGLLPSGDPKCFLLHLYPWEDDFDVNNVKRNRAKVWSLLISIATPQNLIHSSCNTYLVGLGPSGLSHEPVYELLNRDLHSLSSKNGPRVFYTGWNKIPPVFCPTYTYQVDRPAKASVTYSLNGNSTFHACYGISGDLAQIAKKLPSCRSCLLRRLQMFSSQEECRHCHDWRLIGVAYKAPKHYPHLEQTMTTDTESLDGEMVLLFKKITFATMAEAMKIAFVSLVRKENRWTEASAKAFMRVEAIDTSQQQKIINQAKMTRKIFFPSSGSRQQQRRPIQASPSNEHILEYLELPPTHLYPYVDIRIFICALMHHLYLGIAKQTFSDFLLGYLTTKRKRNDWIRDVNTRIKPLFNLRLVNFKLEFLTENSKTPFGKFVSENYLALCRLSKWLYCGIEAYSVSDKSYIDPDIPITEFSKKQCCDWLDAREIQYDGSCCLDELVELIQGIISKNGNQIPGIFIERTLCSEQVVANIMQSLICLVSRVMVKHTLHDKFIAEDADRHIKLFLSYVEMLCRSRRRAADSSETGDLNEGDSESSDCEPIGDGGGKVPAWIKKYNFITLLTIVEDMVYIGSLRHVWEGDGKGEGGLPEVKESILSTKGNWAFHAAERYYKRRSLQRVSLTLVQNIKEEYAGKEIPEALRDMIQSSEELFGQFDEAADEDQNYESENEDDQPTDNDYGSNDAKMNDKEYRCGSSYKSFHFYASESIALEALDMAVPLSVLCFKNGSFGMVLRGGTHMIELTLENQGNRPTTRLGAAYWVWSPQQAPVPIPSNVNGQSISKESSTIDNLRGSILDLTRHNCVFLPHDCFDKAKNGWRYYVITTEYEEILENGTFGRPQLSGATYSKG